MFKKIMILFLCFWMSCGSVFATSGKIKDNNCNQVELEGNNDNCKCNQELDCQKPYYQEGDSFMNNFFRTVGNCIANLTGQFVGGVAFAFGNFVFNNFFIRHVHQN